MPSSSSFQRPLLRCAQWLERLLQGVWRPLTGVLGWRKPRQIVAYRSHGNANHVWVRGRVLGNRPAQRAQPSDGLWKHLGHTIRRWNTFEVPLAEVLVSFGGHEKIVHADRDGFFEADFEPTREARAPTRWVTAESSVAETSVHATHDILIPGHDARALIISDVDDTVIHTGATRLWTITRLTFFCGVHQRRVFDGVAERYRKFIAEDGANPLFYVSSSAWNLYGMLTHILELGHMPRGPLLLQRLGLANNRFLREPGHRHKLVKIESLLADYPDLPAILVGDSGQSDEELYAQAAARNPGRIREIHIRDVQTGVLSKLILPE